MYSGSRSRSPGRDSSSKRRKESSSSDKNAEMSISMANMNQMMLNNMYQQGNMMMAGGVYPNNMMMAGHMMGGGMMPTTGMEMMAGTGMDMMSQSHIDATMGQGVPPGGNMDMNMMSGVMMDPSMMGLSMYSTMPEHSPPEEDKKEIITKACKLTPPGPGREQPPSRIRPPGCRTIFVGGLPDRIRESMVREIFERFGRIHTLRLSKKNFCHIRYERENSVDEAVALTGYRIKLTDKETDDGDEESYANAGWLHVDYAMSRDDQNDYERKQRQALRIQQAQFEQQNMQPDIAIEKFPRPHRHRSPSPVKIQPFTNAMIMNIAEKIKSEENFADTLPTLVSWLERGECSKRNSNQFYSMIQATNSHIRRLFNDKMQSEEELQECKEKVKVKIEKVIEQLDHVAKVFNAAMHQRVWDHFTKPQRKNIETWQKMAQEFNTLKEDFKEKFCNEDYEYNGYMKNMDSNEELDMLKRENESLKFQLEAYKNEVDIVKADSMKEMEKFKAQYIARQALQSAMENKVSVPIPIEMPPSSPIKESPPKAKPDVAVSCGEAKLIGVMSAFLQVHPQGASLDYVASYVRALFPHVTHTTIHQVLQKHSDVFTLNTTGVGANIENRWLFVAFKQT